MNERELSLEKGQQLKNCCKLLIVAGGEVTRDEVLKVLTPVNKNKAVWKVYHNVSTYYLGAFGAYGVVLLRTESGLSGNFSSALELWEPKAVLVIGTAFGINKTKQQIGDVLVSKKIIPYVIKHVRKSFTVDQAEQPAAGSLLKNRFSEIRKWSYKLPSGTLAKNKVCTILSGEVLIDRKEFRDKLKTRFPEAEGGDMNTVKVYTAAHEKNISWISVLGISNFADGENSKNKHRNDLIAIKSAISLAKTAFTSKHSFRDLKLVLSENCSNVIVSAPPPPPPASEDEERVVTKNKRKLVGYKDGKNQDAIPYIYLAGHNFREGLANVKLGVSKEERHKIIEKELANNLPMEEIQKQLEEKGKWGFIDKTGKTVIPHIYEKAFPFKKGKAKVCKDGKMFHINKKGKRIKE